MTCSCLTALPCLSPGSAPPRSRHRRLWAAAPAPLRPDAGRASRSRQVHAGAKNESDWSMLSLICAPHVLLQISTHVLQQRLHVPFRSVRTATPAPLSHPRAVATYPRHSSSQSFELLRSFVQAMYADTVEVAPGSRGGSKTHLLTDAPVAAAASAPGTAFESSGGFARVAADEAGSSRRRTLRVSGGPVSLTVTHAPPDRAILSWSTSPLADVMADSLVAVISQARIVPRALHSRKLTHLPPSLPSSGRHQPDVAPRTPRALCAQPRRRTP